jgi:hypothetical protein
VCAPDEILHRLQQPELTAAIRDAAARQRPVVSTFARQSDGTYDAVLTPGPHTYVVSKPAHPTKTGSFTVTNGQNTLVEACLAGP